MGLEQCVPHGTYEARLADPAHAPLLDALCDLYGRMERAFYVERHVRGTPCAPAKAALVARFGVHHRTSSSVEHTVRARVRGAQEALAYRAERLTPGAAYGLASRPRSATPRRRSPTRRARSGAA
jgi:hypothetical protein